jgi:dihydroorotate dehydrogenase electron transfer subunit
MGRHTIGVAAVTAKQHLCRVTENRILWSGVQLLTFAAPELARALCAGQFALARDPTTLDPYLRRMLWLYRSEDDRVAFTLPACDPLAARARPGDMLDLLAPLGRAIEFDASARHIALIGEGARIAPLIALAHDAIAQAREVVVVSHATSADERFPAHLLSPEIELRTDADALDELVAWADAIVASGSDELYRALADSACAARYRIEPGLAHVLVDTVMPCGTGACYACALETPRGLQRACVDGPAFDLTEFYQKA